MLAPSRSRRDRLYWKDALFFLGCAPLRLLGFLGQLDCPYPELLYNFRFNSGLRKNAASTSLFA
jgi:hypothetical protein